MHEWHDYHFVDEWHRSGLDVVSVNSVLTNGFFDEEKTLLSIISELSRKTSNLLFCTTGDDFMSAGILRELKSLNVALIRLACDDLSVPFKSKRTAKFYDAYWTSCPENVAILTSYGAKCLVMPFAANPYHFNYQPIKNFPKSVIGFIGTPYGSRARDLNAFIESGFNVQIYSRTDGTVSGERPLKPLNYLRFRAKQFKYVLDSMSFSSGRSLIYSSLLDRLTRHEFDSNHHAEYQDPPSFDNFPSIASSLPISFGSTILSNTDMLKKPLHNIRLREFEITSCGGCHLVNRSDLIMEYFDDSCEILMYSSKEEMLDKAAYYMRPDNSIIRNKIAQAARRRVIGSHTWTHRLNKLQAHLDQ